MTAYIPGWNDLSDARGRQDENPRATARDVSVHTEVSESTVGPRVVVNEVTGPMVDEAVELAVRESGLDPQTVEVMKSLMIRDSKSPVTHAFFSSRAAAARTKMVGVAPQSLTCDYVLDVDETRDLAAYAPEFKIHYDKVAGHCHSIGSVGRKVDHRLNCMDMPYGIPFTDLGGDPLYYVEQGITNVHCCGTIVDAKDPQRHVLRMARARRLMAVSDKPEVRAMAKKYVDLDPKFVCGKLGQECDHPTAVVMANHVYDVPLETWPVIMTIKKAGVALLSMLSTGRMLETTVGELKVARARYEVDLEKDVYRMGFKGSPSWWYEHKFSQLMLYNVDQIIRGGQYDFCSRIVDRRGDTVRIRILPLPRERVDRRILPAHYEVPGVDTVEVRGFKLPREADRGNTAGGLDKATYQFPKLLWYEMVSQASEDFERGVMEFSKMYNHYRTMSVRQTINAKLVMGGEQVDSTELVPLVVHACLAAAAQSMLGQRNTRMITEYEMERRYRSLETTFGKVVGVFSGAVKALMSFVLSPLTALAKKVRSAHAVVIADHVLEWQPVCKVKRVPVSMLWTTALVPRGAYPMANEMLKRESKASAAADHYAAVLRSSDLAGLLVQMCPEKAKEVEEARQGGSPAPTAVDAASSVTSPPSYASEGFGRERPPVTREDLHQTRLAAIREHLEELKMGNRALEDLCKRAYNELAVNGKPPSADLLKRKSERYKNPDFWLVENGLLVQSVKGLGIGDFNHMGVYHPRPDPDTGSSLRLVTRKDWEGKKGGNDVVNKNSLIADSKFNGWVLVLDDLTVYNGPEVCRTLEKSLLVRHDYVITTNRGPPGCGKTTKIVGMAKPDGTDASQAPVRESMDDTRRKFVSKYPDFEREARLYFRTLDSYAANYHLNRKVSDLRVGRLLVDEAYMTHAGRVYCNAGLLGVDEVQAFGDEQQIPHVNRVQAPALHVKLVAQSEDWEYRSYRCGPRAVAMWNHLFDFKVRSGSGRMDEVREVTSMKGVEPQDDTVLLCMYQADKIELRKLYARYAKRKGVHIMTVHESQGKTFKHVWLHKFDTRPRSDGMSLFDKEAYLLVAFSRGTHTHYFVNPEPTTGGLASEWVKKANEPRRAAAAADVLSLGKTLEFM